jgi:DNA-binding XRE family transcriptional regulator
MLSPHTILLYTCMCGIIYVIKNVINGKVYVGKTVMRPPEKRWKLHLKIANNVGHYAKKKKCQAIHYAIAKHGKENFSFSIVEDNVSDGYINERECFWIAELKSEDKTFGYNLTSGGEGVALTHERKQKHSQSMCKARDAGKLPWVKLTGEKALEIKQKIISQEYTNAELAKEYNVSKQTIGLIQRNLIFTDILKDTPALEHGINGWYNPGYKNRGGLNNNACRFSKDDIQAMLRMRSEGMTYTDIAKHFRTWRQIVMKWCKKGLT